jgi:hypothetical protein
MTKGGRVPDAENQRCSNQSDHCAYRQMNDGSFPAGHAGLALLGKNGDFTLDIGL